MKEITNVFETRLSVHVSFRWKYNWTLSHLVRFDTLLFLQEIFTFEINYSIINKLFGLQSEGGANGGQWSGAIKEEGEEEVQFQCTEDRRTFFLHFLQL